MIEEPIPITIDLYVVKDVRAKGKSRLVAITPSDKHPQGYIAQWEYHEDLDYLTGDAGHDLGTKVRNRAIQSPEDPQTPIEGDYNVRLHIPTNTLPEVISKMVVNVIAISGTDSPHVAVTEFAPVGSNDMSFLEQFANGAEGKRNTYHDAL